MHTPVAAFIAPYLIALAAFPLITRSGKKWHVLLGVCLPILLSPLFIPADDRLLRFMAAISAVIVAVKVMDAWLDATLRTPPTWREFLAFIGNPFTYVRRCLPMEPRHTLQVNVLRLALGSLGCGLGIVIARELFHVDWHRWPFAIEHSSKVLAFMFAIICGLGAAAALWRLLGGTARDYIQNPFAARTPAEFWQRYNRNMQQFFWQNIFKPVGGLRAPIRTTLLVFAISAVAHEFIFSIAIGRVQGYQTAFFLLHGIAVAVTARVKVTRLATIPWIAGTLAFNLATSMLFFASIHEILPFYSRGLPMWLQW